MRVPTRLRALAPAAALLLPLPGAAAQDGAPGLAVFGVEPQPLGAATLTVETGPDGTQTLKVSNIGSSGCDGVSARLPDEGASGFGLRGASLLDASPAGDDLVVLELTGTVGGGPEQPIGTVTARRVLDPVAGDAFHVSADLSALGARGSTLTVRDRGWVELQQAGLDDDDGVLLPVGPKTKTIYYADITGDETVYVCVVFAEPIEIVGITDPGGGGGEVLSTHATSIEFSTDVAGGPVVVTQADVRYADTPEQALTGMEVVALGGRFTGSGEALLETTGGKLKVSNLGSSGCDGFSIALDGLVDPGSHVAGGALAFDPPGAAGTLPAGALLSARLDATVDGEPHEGFASLTATRGAAGTPDVLSFGCDPDMVTVTWFYEVYDGGTLVTSGDLQDQSFQASAFLDLVESVTWGAGPSGAGDGLGVTLASPTTLLVDGAVHAFDALHLGIGPGASWRVGDKRALAVACDDVPELSITGVTTTPTPFLDEGHVLSEGHASLLEAPLTAGGTLEGGSTTGFVLADAPASSLALLFTGLAPNPTPFKGGELVPFPVLLQVALVTGPDGGIALPFTWPQGVPAGFEVHVQVAVADALAPLGAWLSNALRARAP